jgi:hypothetical protein
MYSRILVCPPAYPREKMPLVELEQAPIGSELTVKSPKSNALPVVSIVI